MRWRKVHDRIWSDAWFRSLDDEAKLFWMYLLTCQHWSGSLPGLYHCWPATMAADMGWSAERVDSMIGRLMESGKLRVDRAAGLVWVVNAHVYQPPDNPKMLISWERSVLCLPECPLREEAWSEIYRAVCSPAPAPAQAQAQAQAPGRRGSDTVCHTVSDHGSDTVSTTDSDSGNAKVSRPLLAQSLRPSMDLTPYLPDICEAQRAAWGMEETPDPPAQGSDDMARLVQAYHIGEGYGPGKGILRLQAAVRAHRARQARPDAERKIDGLRWAYPPAVVGGKASWSTLDETRYHELAEEGLRLDARERRQAPRKRRGDPPDGRTCRDCSTLQDCERQRPCTYPAEMGSDRPDAWDPDCGWCARPGVGWYEEMVR